MSRQPTFPTDHGPPLPDALNPLNPNHYGLLLLWVFFQPSRLKHYYLAPMLRVGATQTLCVHRWGRRSIVTSFKNGEIVRYS